MTRYAFVLVALACFVARAFDSQEWFAKRGMLEQEAERLRGAYSNCVANLSAPAVNIVLPIDTFEDGSVKLSATAKRAQYFLDKGLVWAEDVCIRKFDREGAVVSQVDAKHCVFDRGTKSGWAEGPAAVRHGDTVFEGEGVYFSSPEGYVMVTHHSKIVARDLKFGGIQ